MKKTILIALILIPVLLIASCDSNSLGSMRRIKLGYAVQTKNVQR